MFKKLVLFIFIVFSVSLFSCQNDKDSPLMNANNSISFNSDSYQVERGEYLELNLNSTFTLKNVEYSITQDDKYIEINEDETNSTGKLVIAGKKVGKATLLASCSGYTCSTEIEVIKYIPSLSMVWKNLYELDNYSLYTTKEKDGLIEECFNLSITEQGIIYQYYDSDGTLLPIYYTLINETRYSLYGYGIDSNDYAFELLVDSQGDFSEEGKAVKVSKGFLNKENYWGFKDDMTSSSDVGSFYGLQAINSSWLDTKKQKENKYEIVGSDLDLNSFYTEYLLWGLIDPIGLGNATIYSKEHLSDSFDMIDLVDITVYALLSNKVKFTLKYNTDKIEGRDSQSVYTTEIIDVGETDINKYLPHYSDFVSAYAIELPSLTSDLQLFEDAIGKHNYMLTSTLYWLKEDKTTVSATLYVYYTDKYFMAYYSQELVDVFNNAYNQNISVGGFGFLKQSDGIHQFSYNPSLTNKIEVGQTAIERTTNLSVWQIDYLNMTSMYHIPNYLSNTTFYNLDLLYSFEDEEREIFKETGTYHYSKEKVVFDSLCLWLYEESFVGIDFYSGINVTTKTTNEVEVIDTVDFMLAFSSDKINYSRIITPTLSNFGNAETFNPADTYIQQVL